MEMETLGFTIITDECFLILKPVSLKEVIEVANAAEPKLTKIVREVVKTEVKMRCRSQIK